VSVGTLRAGVFGAGALGRHHVRILSALDGVELVGFHDRNPDVAAAVAAEHGARHVDDYGTLAGKIDIAVVAVPTVLHAELAEDLLARGVDVMVEKPITTTLEEADRLIELANRQQRVVAVGHVEFFNPAVQALIEIGGSPKYLEVRRLGAFSPRSLDIDVVLDLMIHDLQILHALDPSPVTEVRATGISVLSPRVDMANVRIELESGCVANLSASRVAPEKVRELRVFFAHAYYGLDYQTQELRGARLERQGEEPGIVRADLPVEKREPLWGELESFVRACRGEDARIVDGRAGRRALETALRVVDGLEG